MFEKKKFTRTHIIIAAVVAFVLLIAGGAIIKKKVDENYAAETERLCVVAVEAINDNALEIRDPRDHAQMKLSQGYNVAADVGPGANPYKVSENGEEYLENLGKASKELRELTKAVDDTTCYTREDIDAINNKIADQDAAFTEVLEIEKAVDADYALYVESEKARVEEKRIEDEKTAAAEKAAAEAEAARIEAQRAAEQSAESETYVGNGAVPGGSSYDGGESSGGCHGPGCAGAGGSGTPPGDLDIAG